jgi:hypothetical protein
MADPYAELLNSIGFGAADAASEEGVISRKRELGQSQVELNADEERQQLNAGYEGRGVYGSGEALLGNARLEANVANQMSGLDIAAADSYLGLQRDLQREQAQKQSEDRSFNLQVELANRQFDMQRQQVAAQADSQRRYDEAYARSLGRNY